MNNLRRTLLIAMIAFVAAIGGVVAGRLVVDHAPPAGTELHRLLHDQLNLSDAQHAQIETLEKRFALRKQALELELRADNAKLAGAIEAEHGFGPQVSATIDHSHMVMGQLQKETLEHIFAMRVLLNPTQAAQFDRVVVKALTQDAR
jgi:hypothetical protein